MLVAALIERKRDGNALKPEEWGEIIAEYSAGRVPDYQMSALLMAVCLKGMQPDELGALTDAMLESGSRLSFGGATPPRVDKHSTGGVGDKVSLVLAPLLASCGVAVPMMSGRGLGHTGGTLAKLESIPGFRTDLSLEDARRQVETIGCAMIGQTAEVAPADRRLYALRDATGTIESTPLIAASIMSKKLAEDLHGLVLDIKRGSGGFVRDFHHAVELAQTMARIGAARGLPTVALFTAMDRPLGYACGNALETQEAIAALQGDGPADLMEVVYALGVEMLLLAEPGTDRAEARSIVERAVESGRALVRFAQVVEAQGGDPRVAEDTALLPHATTVAAYSAPCAGYVTRIEPRRLGRAIVAMGGGRRDMEDEIDPAVGFLVEVKPGDRVEARQRVATIYAHDDDGLLRGREALDEALAIGDDPGAASLPLVSHRVTEHGVEILG
jgi:pyrimidine-nucleoside phosphorylase